MTIPWWLHRTLIMITMPLGAFAGVIGSLYAIDFLDRYLGSAVVVLYPAGFVIGGLIPHQIFRRGVHAKCPVDGERMVIERVMLP